MSSLSLAILRGLRAGARRSDPRPLSVVEERAIHRRNARRMRRLLGVPGHWRRTRHPAGLSFEPPGISATGPRILFLHGGGYVHGSPGSHARCAARLAQTCGLPVLALRYRLAPEHPFPAALEDVIAAISTLAAGPDDRPLVLIGESAGGGLAVASAAWCRDRESVRLAGVVCLAPWVNLVDQHGAPARWAAQYAPAADHANPLVSPALGSMNDMPPTQIQVGTADELLGQAEDLCDAFASSGVEVELLRWKGAFHGFQHYPVPEARRCFAAVSRFIRKVAGPRQ